MNWLAVLPFFAVWPLWGEGKEQGDTLVVAITAAPDSLNPVLSQAAEPSPLVYGLTSPYLLRERFDCRLFFDTSLAESWEWGEGRRSATFRLRRDRRWEDGRPITAEDVVFTYEVVADPATASPRSNQLSRMRSERPVEAIDSHTVRFHFPEGYEPFAQTSHLTQIGILPRHVFADADRAKLRSHPFGRKPLSGGPFRIERLDEGQEIVLVPNTAGFAERPAFLDRIVFRVIRDSNTRVTELLRGGVDLVYGLQPEEIQRVAQSPDLRIVSRGFRWLDYVAWNCGSKFFRSSKVRKALAHAVDCDKLIDGTQKVGAKRYARRAVSNITPELCGSEAAGLKPIPYDPEKARAMLAEEGWIDSDADGVLDRDGEKFSFLLLTFTESARLVQAAQIVKEMLAKVGVEARIEKREYNKALELLRSRNFDAALVGWQAELWVDPSATLHSGDRYVFNYGNYSNPKVDELLDRAGAEFDMAKAKPIWDALQKEVLEDQPMLFLYWRDSPMAVHKRFRDVQANVLGPLQDLDRWWVPRSEQKYKP